MDCAIIASWLAGLGMHAASQGRRPSRLQVIVHQSTPRSHHITSTLPPRCAHLTQPKPPRSSSATPLLYRHHLREPPTTTFPPTSTRANPSQRPSDKAQHNQQP